MRLVSRSCLRCTLLQEMLVRLIECNDMVMAADSGEESALADFRGNDGPGGSATAGAIGGSGSGGAGSSSGGGGGGGGGDDDGEPDGSSQPGTVSMLFSTGSRRVLYSAETLQSFVSMTSQLPSHLLDDMVLQRLGDLVEQLVFVFPTLVSNNFGAR